MTDVKVYNKNIYLKIIFVLVKDLLPIMILRTLFIGLYNLSLLTVLVLKPILWEKKPYFWIYSQTDKMKDRHSLRNFN